MGLIDMKNVLITGAARGLGRCLAEFLSKNGYFIYGTTRDLQMTEDTDKFKFIYLDLRDRDSIDQLYNHLTTLNASIDVLIHNSGVAYLDPADLLDEEESRHIFEVNFFGPIYLTKKILPMMRKANSGNIIFISSIVSIDHWPYLGVYAASKAAIESVAFEWAVLLKKWNIHVSVIRPNPLPTDMQILRSKNVDNSPYPDLRERDLSWEKVDDVCLVISQILNSPSPYFAYQTGPFSEETAQHFLNKNAYQNALEQYQKKFGAAII